MSFKTLEKNEDGREYIFNTNKFQHLYDEFQKEALCQTKKKKGTLQKELAGLLNVDVSTLKGWWYGRYSPHDIGIVKNLASIWGLEDYHVLLQEQKKEPVIDKKMSDYEMKAVREIYSYFVDIIEQYYDIFFNRYTIHKEPDEDSVIHPDPRDGEPNDLYRQTIIFLRKRELDIPEEMMEKIQQFVHYLFPMQDMCYYYFPTEDDGEDEGRYNYGEYKEYLKNNPWYQENTKSVIAQLGFVMGQKEKAYAKLRKLFEDYIGYIQ